LNHHCGEDQQKKSIIINEQYFSEKINYHEKVEENYTAAIIGHQCIFIVYKTVFGCILTRTQTYGFI